MTNYLSPAETAKYVRKALKESFPGVKFSVRSSKYSGGGSINIGWTDGPTSKLVEDTIGHLAGGYFDGMIDYKGSRYHEIDGERVHFGADFLFFNRDSSPAAEARAYKAMTAKWRTYDAKGNEVDPPTLEDYHEGRSWGYFVDSGAHRWWSEEFRGELAKRGDRMVAEPSPTLASIKFAGDDGYGAGTVGPNNDGDGDGAYKAIEAARERVAAEEEAKRAKAARDVADIAKLARDFFDNANGTVH